MAIVEVDGLVKRYRGRTVVDDVTFAVESGEIFGVLGPNGAGKTTTVECVAGLRVPDGGRVEVLGLDPQRQGPVVRRRLGVQLQESRLQGKLKVWEALDLHAAFHDDPADWRELLDLLGLAEHRNQRFEKLSGGQKQRLSIALALVGRPQVAILDELTTGLDPQARRDTWSLIERVRETGVTILLVTHFMEEAQHLCDRLAIIDGGQVVALDTPDAIVAKVAEEQQLRFVPSEPIEDRALADLASVTNIRRDGDEVVVNGTHEVVHEVVAALAREQIVAQRLRVEQRTLDDAFVALTGQPLEDRTSREDDRKVGR